MFSLKSNLIIAFIALSAFSVVVNAQKKNETDTGILTEAGASTSTKIATTTDGPSKISCFVCNSVNDTGCDDRTPGETKHLEKYKMDCPSIYEWCRITIQTLEYSIPDTKEGPFTITEKQKNRVIRSCAKKIVVPDQKDYTNKCYLRSGYGGKQTVCQCTGSYCNYASSLKATFGIILTSFMILVARF